MQASITYIICSVVSELWQRLWMQLQVGALRDIKSELAVRRDALQQGIVAQIEAQASTYSPSMVCKTLSPVTEIPWSYPGADMLVAIYNPSCRSQQPHLQRCYRTVGKVIAPVTQEQ